MTILVGHERVIDLLDQTVEQGRPAHAYLFTGREGIGKKLAAIRFACRLNCPDPALDPNGTCGVCKRIVQGNHPDVTIEVPDRGQIRIDRVRSLQSFFRYAPVEGAFRVIIIDDAHTMNPAAQNALLKTLEEPPKGRILILVTATPYFLLPTVRSRCRRIRFAPLDTGTLADLLERERGMSPQRAHALAAMSGGSVSRSLEMDSPGFSDLQEQMLSFLTDPGGNGISGIVDVSAAISSDRKRALDAIEIAVKWTRDRMVESVADEDANPIRDYSLDRNPSADHQRTDEAYLSVYDELSRASELIGADINVNRNLVTDVMLLRIARILAGPAFGVTRAER